MTTHAQLEQLYDGKLDEAVEIMLDQQGANNANRNS